MIRLALAVAALVASTSAPAREPAGLHRALSELSRDGKFSGAVVVRGAEGVRFARGYGFGDPFTNRPFTPDTSVDSGSLAKPVTHAAVLMLARDGSVALDAPVQRYLHEYPHPQTTVRHLLAHSAGLPFEQSPKGLAGKSNAALLVESGKRQLLFVPGSNYRYCNLCSIALALLIERVSGMHYLDFARRRAQLPAGTTIRPMRLDEWTGRALGYRRTADGKIERYDSWEGEAFYGPANLSISANQLARWGSEWWRPPLRLIRDVASETARIGGKPSGMTLGNWYCAPKGLRCHYLGHHEGFHHMLYWDADRRISVAMVTNNSLAPSLHQRLQRALVAFAEGRTTAARRELAAPAPTQSGPPGSYLLPGAEPVTLSADGGSGMTVKRSGLRYPAYPVGSGIRYVPGLDVYVAGTAAGRLHWLSLYEDFQARPTPRR